MLKYQHPSFIVVFLLICSTFKLSDAGDTCWTGTQGAAVAAAATNAANANDYCKRITTVPAGFGAYASVVGSVSLTSDTACTSSNCLAGSTGTLAAGCTLTTTTNGITTTIYCITADSTAAGTVAKLAAPALTSCYTAWSSTSYTGTATTGTGQFCKTTYTVGASSPSIASTVTLTGLAASCATTSPVGAAGSSYDKCCSVNDCNKILYCYVGVYTASTGANTLTKSICMPTNGQYCSLSYSYNSGTVVTGACEDTCSASTVSITSTTASGKTCCSTAICNTLSAAVSFKASLTVQFVFLLVSFMTMKNIF